MTTANRTATYREISPPPVLRDHVICFWRRPAGSGDRTMPILPDGCIDVIWAGDAPPMIAGPMTVAVLPTIASNADILGVRFQPGSAPALLGVSATELLNQHLSLRAIWSGPRHQPWAEAAEWDALASRIAAISGLIAEHAASSGTGDPFMTAASRWLAAHPASSLSGLTRLSGLSGRQVRRRFDAAIGYGPKTLQRILRLQRLLWLASHPASARSLGQLAFAAGYADQPHMTRDVLALTGASPTKLLLDTAPRSAVSDLFKTPER